MNRYKKPRNFSFRWRFLHWSKKLVVITMAVPQFISLLIMLICWMTLGQLTHCWKTGAGSSNSFPDWSVLCKSLCYLCQYVNWYPSYYANFYRDYPKFGSWPNRSGVIGNINNFNVIFLLTVNGPTNSNFYGAGSTDLLVTWLYLTVTKIDYNLSSVIGILIFIYMQKFIYY